MCTLPSIASWVHQEMAVARMTARGVGADRCKPLAGVGCKAGVGAGQPVRGRAATPELRYRAATLELLRAATLELLKNKTNSQGANPRTVAKML